MKFELLAALTGIPVQLTRPIASTLLSMYKNQRKYLFLGRVIPTEEHVTNMNVLHHAN